VKRLEPISARPPSEIDAAVLHAVDIGSEPIAAEAAAQVAAEAAITAEAMVQIASVAATKVMAKATHTAEVAMSVAAVTAADIVADAGDVADAMVVAAAAAAEAAEKVRHTVAGAISAEAAAKLAMAQSAERLSEELARRIAIEARLLAQESELTAFAGMVAHDLKAPLRAVGGFTKMLRSDLIHALGEGLEKSTRDRMDKIVSAVERMTALIDDLLAFATARDRTLRRQPVDLCALVTQLVDEHTDAVDDGAAPPTFVIGPLPTVHADPSMCRQLLDNLIGNALKYTLPETPAYVLITSRAEDGNMVRVEIVDHGVGVPPGQHALVFNALHRSHAGYPGTGLGLAICQRIVDRHGGAIGVMDNPGGGSHFYFTLPTDSEPAAEPAAAPAVPPPAAVAVAAAGVAGPAILEMEV
jgi:signal transduction histidine kinase